MICLGFNSVKYDCNLNTMYLVKQDIKSSFTVKLGIFLSEQRTFQVSWYYTLPIASGLSCAKFVNAFDVGKFVQEDSDARSRDSDKVNVAHAVK